MSSAGKLTNASLSCLKWISENVQSFVERTFFLAKTTQLWFFDTLCALATGQRFEVIGVADLLKQRLRDAAYQADDTKMLIGISKNEQHVKAISKSYSRSAVQRQTKKPLPLSVENIGTH